MVNKKTAESHCRCPKEKAIVPVRYALRAKHMEEEKGNAAAMSWMKDKKLPDTMEAPNIEDIVSKHGFSPITAGLEYTCRTLRQGWLYISARDFFYEYQVVTDPTAGTVFKKTGGSESDGAPYICVPESTTTAYFLWTSGQLSQKQKDTVKKSMQPVTLCTGYPHYLGLDAGLQEVEEYKGKPAGFLTLRHYHQSILDGDMQAYGEDKAADTASIEARWELYSIATKGLRLPDFSHFPNFPVTKVKEVNPEISLKCQPCVVALPDPIGVAQDLNGLYSACLTEMHDYMAWHGEILEHGNYIGALQSQDKETWRDLKEEYESGDMKEYITMYNRNINSLYTTLFDLFAVLRNFLKTTDQHTGFVSAFAHYNVNSDKQLLKRELDYALCIQNLGLLTCNRAHIPYYGVGNTTKTPALKAPIPKTPGPQTILADYLSSTNKGTEKAHEKLLYDILASVNQETSRPVKPSSEDKGATHAIFHALSSGLQLYVQQNDTKPALEHLTEKIFIPLAKRVQLEVGGRDRDDGGQDDLPFVELKTLQEVLEEEMSEEKLKDLFQTMSKKGVANPFPNLDHSSLYKSGLQFTNVTLGLRNIPAISRNINTGSSFGAVIEVTIKFINLQSSISTLTKELQKEKRGENITVVKGAIAVIGGLLGVVGVIVGGTCAMALGVIGVCLTRVLAILSIIQVCKRGDYWLAATIGVGTIAAGVTIFSGIVTSTSGAATPFLFGLSAGAVFGISIVISIIIIIVEYLIADSKAEDWLQACFWGEDSKYGSKDRTAITHGFSYRKGTTELQKTENSTEANKIKELKEAKGLLKHLAERKKEFYETFLRPLPPIVVKPDADGKYWFKCELPVSYAHGFSQFSIEKFTANGLYKKRLQHRDYEDKITERLSDIMLHEQDYQITIENNKLYYTIPVTSEIHSANPDTKRYNDSSRFGFYCIGIKAEYRPFKDEDIVFAIDTLSVSERAFRQRSNRNPIGKLLQPGAGIST